MRKQFPSWPCVRRETTVVPSFLVVLDLLQDVIVQFDNICVLLKERQPVVPVDNLANAYLLSELIFGAVDANDEVSTTNLMLTWSDFCVRSSDKTRSRL